MTLFRDHLLLWLDRRGLSQSEAASVLHVPVRSLQEWCQGRKTPAQAEALVLLMQMVDERDGVA